MVVVEGSNSPMEEYEVIYLDPPWDYYGDPNKMGAAGKEYNLMTVEELADLKIPLAKPGVVFMWATGPKLDIAMDLLKAWGLHYRGIAFVWVKTRKDGVPIKAQGVRPSVIKPLTELVLVASTEKLGRPLPLASEKVIQTVFAPRREHSRKPDEVRERIEALYPTASKLEMFARTKVDGWDVHGDQTDLFEQD